MAAYADRAEIRQFHSAHSPCVDIHAIQKISGKLGSVATRRFTIPDKLGSHGGTCTRNYKRICTPVHLPDRGCVQEVDSPKVKEHR